jgi:transglutaminase-like putative cysteine protease
MRQSWWPQRALMPEPEESILFRVLTQALVSVGIIATDIAAETHLSVWAIPLSLIGATWSWMRRHDRNIPTKFALAIGMLVALATFFVNLIGNRELNDTRLVLVELLIQLQVLHSFDLPRRKDLGYSMIIGLILIGVASTLSQTMIFGVLLLVFLAIALPVLVMDYRSRLGLSQASNTKLTLRKVNFSSLPFTFAVTLALGLSIFAVMPRFSGYQLRSFPMSPQMQLQGEFNNRQITNPGYVRNRSRGQGTGGQGTGTTRNGESGQMDKTFYYGFGDRINQNLRGQLEPKVVMRVRSQAEGFWRVQAFDRYTGQGWELARNNQTKTLTRSEWSYQFFLPRPVTLNKTKEVIQTYTIVSELPNLIPALTQPKELYFPTTEVAIDSENGLRAPLPLDEGMTYTVVSEVPYRDRTWLQRAAIGSPKDGQSYLQIPPQIAAGVRRETQTILSKSEKAINSPYEKALYLAQYLKQRYKVRPDLPLLQKNEDLTEAFLFKYKGGYPDHFSTALTMMLRSIGISARLVVGFAPGEFNPFTGLYVVRNTDAYAMTEVYFPKFGWFAFDPIPGHELIPPSIEEDQTFSVLQRFWQWVAGWLPSPVAGVLNRVISAIMQGLAAGLGWLIGLFSRGWMGLFTGLILATCLSFLGWLSWQGWQKIRYRRWLNKLSPMESLYQQMLRWLATQGFRKHPAQTPLEYARQAQEVKQNSAQTIQEISQAYVSWRYGGQSANLRELQQKFRTMQKKKRD